MSGGVPMPIARSQSYSNWIDHVYNQKLHKHSTVPWCGRADRRSHRWSSGARGSGPPRQRPAGLTCCCGRRNRALCWSPPLDRPPTCQNDGVAAYPAMSLTSRRRGVTSNTLPRRASQTTSGATLLVPLPPHSSVLWQQC